MILFERMTARRTLITAALATVIGCAGTQTRSTERAPRAEAPVDVHATASSSPASDTESVAPPTPETPSAEDPADTDTTGRGDAACTGLYDDDRGIPAPSRSAVASYFLTGGSGRDTRFQVHADRSIDYVTVDREGPRCFRGTVTAEAIDTFRAALQHAGACRLPNQRERPVPDRGPLTLAFRLPGVTCSARIVRGSERDFDRLEAVYRAFDTLGAPVCGRYCSRVGE